MNYGGGLVLFSLLIHAISITAMESNLLPIGKGADEVTTLLEDLEKGAQELALFSMAIFDLQNQKAIVQIPDQMNLTPENEHVGPNEETPL